MTRQRDRDSAVLQHVLTWAGIENFVVEEDEIYVPFTYSDPNLFEGETEIWLVASLRDNLISIEMPLLEFDQDQDDLDTILSQLLGVANRDMDVAQFALTQDGLSIRADFDTRELRYGEIEAGIEALFRGFAIYIGILSCWFESLVENESVDFKEQDRVAEKEIQRVARGEQSNWDATKTQVIQAIGGVVSFGVMTAVIAGLSTVLGLPPAAVPALVAAFSASRSKRT